MAGGLPGNAPSLDAGVHLRRLAVVLALVPASSCGDNELVAQADGGPPVDASIIDAAEIGDGPPPLAWVDFTASGCALDAGGETVTCSGEAPLTVTFQALTPSPIEEYRWRFGDEGDGALPESAAIPTHTYLLPGSYDVSLSASGPGGSGSAMKVGFIVVQPAGTASSCSLDEQCEEGSCLCAGNQDCPAELRGVCYSQCEVTACPEGTIGIDLEGTSGLSAWERCLCALPCGDGDACPAGSSCQSFLGGDGSWTRACFAPGLLRAMGSSCRSEAGTDDDLCASRLCEDRGARGLCTASCASSEDCPQGSTCASFGSGESRCLARCSSFSCDGDPWLGCESPGITAPQGFTIDEAPDAAGYCAPKRCESDDECGEGGACVADYCGPA